MKLSLVTTAYNETKIIKKTILAWSKWLNKQNIKFEIIVYNDGSTDDTLKKLKELRTKLTSLKIINGKMNKGYGFGMRQSIKKSKNKYIVTIDSDNQYELANIKVFFPLINKKDQFFTGHRVKKKDNYLKILADLILRLIVRLIFNTKIKDTNCALKMFDRKILKKIKLFSNDYSLPTELSLKAEMLGLDIVDLPIKHKSRQDGESKINIIFTSLKFLKFLIKLKSKFIIYEKK